MISADDFVYTKIPERRDRTIYIKIAYNFLSGEYSNYNKCKITNKKNVSD